MHEKHYNIFPLASIFYHLIFLTLQKVNFPLHEVYEGEYQNFRLKLKSQNAFDKQRLEAQTKVQALKNKLKTPRQRRKNTKKQTKTELENKNTTKTREKKQPVP